MGATVVSSGVGEGFGAGADFFFAQAAGAVGRATSTMDARQLWKTRRGETGAITAILSDNFRSRRPK
jgi:hypothetical protein